MKTKARYHRDLTEEEISDKVHRNVVGGMWDEIGKLQFDFLNAEGLRADVDFLDVGCGVLRGGLSGALAP